MDNTPNNVDKKFFLKADKSFNIYVRSLRARFPLLFVEEKDAFLLKKEVQVNKYFKIDYRSDSLIFNQAYFLKNLYKCFIFASFLESINFNPPKNIVDVGCGAGTFSIAFIKIFSRADLTLNLIDSSREQLQFLEITKKDIIFNSFYETFPPKKKVDCPGLRLASYWLCEQDTNYFDKEIIKSIIDMGIIIIDYKEVIDRFISLLANEYESNVWSFRFETPRSTFKYIKQDTITLHGATIFQKK